MKEELKGIFLKCVGTITHKGGKEVATYHLTEFGKNVLLDELVEYIENKEKEAFEAGQNSIDGDGEVIMGLDWEDYKS